MAKLNLIPAQITSVAMLPQGEDVNKLIDGNIATMFNSGNYSTMKTPGEICIDLRAIHTIDKIQYYDGAGNPQFQIYYGNNPYIGMTLHSTVTQTAYNSYVDITLNISARFLVIKMVGSGVGEFPTEMSVWGTQTGVTEAWPTAVTTPYYNFEQLFGICSFQWVQDVLHTPFPIIRYFQVWEWVEKNADKLLKFEYSYTGSLDGDVDYAYNKAQGRKIVPCINEKPAWMRLDYPNGVTPSESDKPLAYNASTTDPSSYVNMSQYFWQVANRYGRVTRDSSYSRNDPSPAYTNDPGPFNTYKSGLDLLEYIECENEPDKDWKTRFAMYWPDEFAAYMSAMYDGHEGTMNVGKTNQYRCGIKDADPSMKVVLGGLAYLPLEYIKRMAQWARWNRTDQKFPADVISFHYYPNTNNSQGGSGGTGVCPELGNVKQKFTDLVTFRNTYLPGIEIWCTEFGYDTTNTSSQGVPVISGFSNQQVQAMWICRNWLEIAASGIERAFLFMTYDSSQSGGGLYQSSGLVNTSNFTTTYTKKISWYHSVTMKTILTGFKFTSDLSSGSYKCYKFSSSTEDVFVIWSPTQNNTVINNQPINIGSTQASGILTVMNDATETGDNSSITITSQNITVNINEIPKYIKVLKNGVLNVTRSNKIKRLRLR